MTNLKNWKIHLPIDAKGGKTGAAWQIMDLIGFSHPPYFVQNADGSLTFSAPVDGAKTSNNTKYARSELREMNLKADGSQGSEAAWMLSKGGTMRCQMTVGKTPTQKDGKPGHQVIGQIHGAKDELVRLYREGDGRLEFHCDHALKDNKEHVFKLVDASGKQAVLPLGKKFDYTIQASLQNVTVSAVIDGAVYRASLVPNAGWAKDKFYFKAGVYLGVNAAQGGKGDGGVTIYAIEVSH